MTAHTPGPWTIKYDNDGNGSYSEWFNVGPARVQIQSDNRERAKADAAIISAALDLLAMLEHTTRYLEHPDVQAIPFAVRAETVVAQARTAIAAATQSEE